MTADLEKLRHVRHFGSHGFAETIRTLLPRGSIWQMPVAPFQFHPEGIGTRETFGTPAVGHV